LLAGGIGFIPTTLFYQAAVGGLLGKMLYDLSELYGTSLTKQKIKPLLPLFSEARIPSGLQFTWETISRKCCPEWS
jgi:hypothetical protein